MTLPSWVPRSRPGPVHLHRTSSWRDDSPLSQPRPASRVPRRVEESKSESASPWRTRERKPSWSAPCELRYEFASCLCTACYFLTIGESITVYFKYEVYCYIIKYIVTFNDRSVPAWSAQPRVARCPPTVSEYISLRAAARRPDPGLSLLRGRVLVPSDRPSRDKGTLFQT